MPLLSPITDSINNKSRPYARPKKPPSAWADPLSEDFVHSAFILDLLWMAGWVHQFLNSNWFLQSGQKGCILPDPNLVFVVDDDKAVLRALQRLLRQYGYDSRLFDSGEAIENHSDFEGVVCIILDNNLNDRSGIDVRYGLKAAGISVPVIYITGKDSLAVREEALKSG